MENYIPVSNLTEKILSRRRDDFRVEMMYDIMFDDNIGGMHPNRTVMLMSDNNEKPTQITLDKAKFLDTYQYNKTNLDDMKRTIEENIGNILTMKRNGAGLNGMPPLKDVWLFVFAMDENAKIIPNTYLNPNSQDIGDILRTDKPIIMCGFVLSHPTAFNGEKLPEGYPENVNEWIFISPVMEDHMEEYNRITEEIECDKLKHMFMLDFKESK